MEVEMLRLVAALGLYSLIFDPRRWWWQLPPLCMLCVCAGLGEGRNRPREPAGLCYLQWVLP